MLPEIRPGNLFSFVVMVNKVIFRLLCVVLTCLPRGTSAYDLDQILPANTPRDCECAPWTSQAFSALMFADPEQRLAAGAKCAQPAKQPAPDRSQPIYDVQAGWCFCADADPTRWFSFCDPPHHAPSQINLLAVNATAVVVNFVTYDNGTTSRSRVLAELREAVTTSSPAFASSTRTFDDGFSTRYAQPNSTHSISYHSVTLSNLLPRTRYEYRVSAPGRHGGDHGPWSGWQDFTSLYATGPTKFAIYADMGVFPNANSPFLPATAVQNIGNLVDDLQRGLIDFAVHSGDHAYEFPMLNGSRGDGYMEAYSKFLAHAPWVPGWGNHEYLEDDRGWRLANITAGLIREKRHQSPGGHRPERTNHHHRLHYSVDVGLVHILQLDLSAWFCRFPGCIQVDACGVPDEWIKNASEVKDPVERYDFPGLRRSMLEFIRADLTAVDRARTPWVIVTSHFPLYDTYDPQNNLAREARSADGAARAWNRKLEQGARQHQDAPSQGGLDQHHTPHRNTFVPSKQLAIADLEPLLKEFRVDMYMAGHNHNYETTWPVYDGIVQQKSFHLPRATVHFVSGAAGPPEQDSFQPNSPEWSREPRLEENSYSRITIFDRHSLQFEQVANDNGTVIDRFVITRRADED